MSVTNETLIVPFNFNSETTRLLPRIFNEKLVNFNKWIESLSIDTLDSSFLNDRYNKGSKALAKLTTCNKNVDLTWETIQTSFNQDSKSFTFLRDSFISDIKIVLDLEYLCLAKCNSTIQKYLPSVLTNIINEYTDDIVPVLLSDNGVYICTGVYHEHGYYYFPEIKLLYKVVAGSGYIVRFYNKHDLATKLQELDVLYKLPLLDRQSKDYFNAHDVHGMLSIKEQIPPKDTVVVYKRYFEQIEIVRTYGSFGNGYTYVDLPKQSRFVFMGHLWNPTFSCTYKELGYVI